MTPERSQIEGLAREISNAFADTRISVDFIGERGMQLEVFVGRRLFVLEYRPPHGYGVDEIADDYPPFDIGLRNTFGSFGETKRCLIELVRGAYSGSSDRKP